MKFLVDRCLGTMVANHLELAGVDIIPFQQHFTPSTPDIVWLEWCGQNNVVALTKDRNIERTELEFETVKAAKVRLYALVSKRDLTGPQMASVWLATMPKVSFHAAKYNGPLIARVYRSTDLKVYRDFGGLTSIPKRRRSALPSLDPTLLKAAKYEAKRLVL